MRRLPIALAVAAALALPAAALGAVAISTSTSVSTVVEPNGFDQTATFDVTMTVTGGTTNGWKVTAWAPAPKSGTRSLGAVEVSAEPSASCTGGHCVAPRPTGLSWPITLGSTSGGAVKVYNAAARTGTGTDTVSVPFGVGVDADALAGAYTTTITFAIANGP